MFRQQSKRLEFAQRKRRQAITAALVARKRGLVHNHYRSAGPAEVDGGGGTGRASSDDQDINVSGVFGHVAEATGQPLQRDGAHTASGPQHPCPGIALDDHLIA